MFHLFNQLDNFGNYNIEHITSLSPPRSETKIVMEERKIIAEEARGSTVPKIVTAATAAKPPPAKSSAAKPPPAKPSPKQSPPSPPPKKQASSDCSRFGRKDTCINGGCSWNDTFIGCYDPNASMDPATICPTFKTKKECDNRSACSFYNGSVCRPYDSTTCLNTPMSGCSSISKCLNCQHYNKQCFMDKDKDLCAWIGNLNAYNNLK